MDPLRQVDQRHRVAWPTFAWVLARPWRLLAFGGGVGLIRPGSGTWGSLLGLLLWWPLQRWMAEPWLLVLVVGCVVMGIWVCARTVVDLGVPDHVGIVWDEMAALWLLLWCLPDDGWVLAAGFLLFRWFDIAKPFPIDWLDQHCKGGLGVMVDDLVAALYAVVGAWGGWWWWQRAF